MINAVVVLAAENISDVICRNAAELTVLGRINIRVHSNCVDPLDHRGNGMINDQFCVKYKTYLTIDINFKNNFAENQMRTYIILRLYFYRQKIQLHQHFPIRPYARRNCVHILTQLITLNRKLVSYF